MAMKQRVFEIIRDDVDKRGAGRVFDLGMTAVIVINVLFIVIDTFQGRPAVLATVSRVVEVASVALFTVEYAARLWTADLRYPDRTPWRARGRFVRSGLALVDLLAILPFYLPLLIPVDLRVLRMFRLVRLVRVLKLARYNAAVAAIGRVLKKSAPQLVSSIGVVLMLMVMGSVLMYYVEGERQPEQFSNALSGLWWAIATLTTVGYGDVYPVTGLGRILSALIALLGIGLVAVPTGIITAGFAQEVNGGDG
jgi:voltage-gated potassium channel